MRITSWRAAWVVVAVGLLAAMTPAAQAQRRLLVGQPAEATPTVPPAKSAEAPAAPAVRVTSPPVAAPARVTEAPAAGAAPDARVTVATPTPGLSIQTTVRVPDGGTALLGGYSTAAQTRAEYGAPGLGKVPVLGRGFRNVGYGQTLTSRKAGVSVRVIDLREEEFRQTGFRSP